METGTDIKRILIITGGNVDKDFAALWLKKNHFDRCIAVDKGAEAAVQLGLGIDLLLGDFDSLDGKLLEKLRKTAGDVREYGPEKDETDTFIAIKAAMELAPEEIYILGATGSRADHTFTSLMNILYAKEKSVDVFAVDKYNKIYAAAGDICIEKKDQHGDHVSLAVVTDSARISLKGLKYELDNETVKRGSSLCQSNEIIEDKARISVKDGMALIFESKDEE